MTTTHREAGIPPDVRDLWRASSVASVWLRPADWYHPAVDALIEAVVAGDDGGPAAERLGEARAESGVGISETIDDLACLYDALGIDGPPLTLVRSVCEGWAAGQASGPVLTHCIDPDSGLPTSEYLGVRLSETYGVADRTGHRAGDTHALLFADVESRPLAPWSRIVRSAVIGQALVLAFGDGHPMAALGGGVFAVLVERGPDLGATAMDLRTRLAEHARSMGAQDLVREPPRVWLEPLPDTRMQAVELLDHLRR